MERKNKRGISPLIATVLIIGFTITMSAFILHFRTDLFDNTQVNNKCIIINDTRIDFTSNFLEDCIKINGEYFKARSGNENCEISKPKGLNNLDIFKIKSFCNKYNLQFEYNQLNRNIVNGGCWSNNK